MRKVFCFLLAAILLTGCAGTGAPASTTTKATVPSQSPTEMLSHCVQSVLQASSFQMEFALGDEKENFDIHFSLKVAKDTRGGYVAYWEKPCGCAEYVSGKTYVSYYCEAGEGVADTAEDYLEMPYLLRMLPVLEEAVLERFCNTALTATPGANGSMRFEIDGLTEAEMEQLLGEEMDVEPDFVGFFAIEIDAGGNLTEAVFPRGGMINRIRITGINQKLDIPKPDWA